MVSPSVLLPEKSAVHQQQFSMKLSEEQLLYTMAIFIATKPSKVNILMSQTELAVVETTTLLKSHSLWIM